MDISFKEFMFITLKKEERINLSNNLYPAAYATYLSCMTSEM